MVDIRPPFGFVCPEIELKAVQLTPTLEQQLVIDDYREAYRKAMQREPHGLHYLPFPGEPETVAVWLPVRIEGEDLSKPFVDPAGDDVGIEG